MVQLGRLNGNLRTKLSSKNAINHRIAQAPPRRFPRRPTIHYFRRLKRSPISVCGPIVDQVRQDFWAAGACKCDTRKALDFPTRDQGVGGSNPLAPTTSKRSGPETWVTQRTSDMGNTFGPNGFSIPVSINQLATTNIVTHAPARQRSPF
jgi:hypothetical protein